MNEAQPCQPGGQRQSQIRDQMGALEREIESLTQTIGTLSDRLSVVLIAESPSAENTKPESVTVVPLAEEIQLCATKIRNQKQRIENMTARCEL